LHAGFHLGGVAVPPKGSKREKRKTSGASRQVSEQIRRFRGVVKTIPHHYNKRIVRRVKAAEVLCGRVPRLHQYPTFATGATGETSICREAFMHSITDQLIALQRIAAFSASLRGHELGEWRTGEGLARARCVHCGREVHVYCSPIQPDVEGPGLEDACVKRAAEAA